MSELTIWNRLKESGYSDAGTAGIMGNLMAESLLKSNNVEDRCKESDEDYTASVDTGAKGLNEFSKDAYGYGLAQWTYYTRKTQLYLFAKNRGVSISDETMQVDFLIKELEQYYSDLNKYLLTTDDVNTASDRFCKEFENPAVCNYSTRQKYSQEIYNRHKGTIKTEPVKTVEANTEATQMPVLKQGDKGLAVGAMQFMLSRRGYLLTLDCDFGSKTLTALNKFKVDNHIDNIGNNMGKCGAETWEKLYK